MADHLSRLQFEESTGLPINDYMRDDTLLKVSTIDSLYANIINYIVVGYIPPGADKKKIIWDSRLHLWDDPYLYRVCWSPKNSHQWWRIALHWLDLLESSHGSCSWSPDCHSISRRSKSRISSKRHWIKCAEAGGASSVSIPNGLQNTNRHDALSASRWEDMSPPRRTWTQSFLGHQKVEHGPQGGRTKRKIQIAKLEEWREKAYHSAKLYKRKNQKMARQVNRDQAIETGR
jgi:hypothetical protein